jgi:hypothetical protein
MYRSRCQKVWAEMWVPRRNFDLRYNKNEGFIGPKWVCSGRPKGLQIR